MSHALYAARNSKEQDISARTPPELQAFISRNYPMEHVIPLFTVHWGREGKEMTALIRHAGGIYEIEDKQVHQLMTDELAVATEQRDTLVFLIDLFCKQASLLGIEEARFSVEWYDENLYNDAEFFNVTMYMWFFDIEDMNGRVIDKIHSTEDFAQAVLEQITERNGPVRHMLGVATLMSMIALGKDDAIAADGTRLVHYATTGEHVRQLKLGGVDFAVRDSVGRNVIDHMKEHNASQGAIAAAQAAL
jgi:hypothetical protein